MPAELKQNTWMISSSMIIGTPRTGGLSWWQSWLCVWIGYTISGTFICMTGRIGATYHISFPVVTRASFGIWGSLWPVFNRAAMACVCPLWIYYGVYAILISCRSGMVCRHGSEVFHLICLFWEELILILEPRPMRYAHDQSYLDKVYRFTKRLVCKLRYQHKGFPQLLPILALQSAGYLVSCP